MLFNSVLISNKFARENVKHKQKSWQTLSNALWTHFENDACPVKH